MLQRLAQVGVPTQGGGSVASRQFALHERPVRRLVFGVDLRQPFPLAAGAQQLQMAFTQTFAGTFGPGFEACPGQQVAWVGGGNVGTVGRVALRQRGVGALLETQRVHHHRTLWPQQHLAALQHDAVVAPQGLARVVGGLAQVGGTGLGFELRPQRIDHLVARQALVRMQAQQLHQLRSAQAGPAFAWQFDAVDGDSKATEKEGVEAVEGTGRHVGRVDVHACQRKRGRSPPQALRTPGTIQERRPGNLRPRRATVRPRQPPKEQP